MRKYLMALILAFGMSTGIISTVVAAEPEFSDGSEYDQSKEAFVDYEEISQFDEENLSAAISDGVKIGDNVQAELRGETLYLIGKGDTYDYRGAFINPLTQVSWHETVKKIVIGSGITHIGDNLFGGFYDYVFNNVTEIELGEDIKSIGEYAFASLKIREVIFPEGLKKLGTNVLDGCVNLEKIKFPSSLEIIPHLAEDGENLYKVNTVIIPEGVRVIGAESFSFMFGLKSIELPSTIEEIGEGAFSQCSNLSSIKLSEGIKKIGEHAFEGCSSLKEIKFPEGLVEIGQGSLYGCESIEELSFPSTLKSIPPISSGLTNLKKVIISEGVTEIQDSAFEGDINLTEVKIPSTIMRIGNYAFRDCNSVKDIILQEGLLDLGYCVFEGCNSIDELFFPSTLSGIPMLKVGVYGLENLEKVTIAEGVTEILSGAFRGGGQ